MTFAPKYFPSSRGSYAFKSRRRPVHDVVHQRHSKWIPARPLVGDTAVIQAACHADMSVHTAVDYYSMCREVCEVVMSKK